VSALRDQRTKPATSVASLDTSPETAQTPLLRELAVEEVVVPVATRVVVDPKSATSAQRLVTLHETAQRPVATVVDNNRAAMEDNRVVTVVATVEPVVLVDSAGRPVTLVVVTDTCPATAPRVRSATTVVRLVT